MNRHATKRHVKHVKNVKNLEQVMHVERQPLPKRRPRKSSRTKSSTGAWWQKENHHPYEAKISVHAYQHSEHHCGSCGWLLLPSLLGGAHTATSLAGVWPPLTHRPRAFGRGACPVLPPVRSAPQASLRGGFSVDWATGIITSGISWVLWGS